MFITLETKFKILIQQHFSRPDNDVYHFTNDEARHNILTTQCLRLKEHRELNKKNHQELVPAKKQIMRILDKYPHLIPVSDTFLADGLWIYTSSFCRNSKSASVINQYGSNCIRFNPSCFPTDHRLFCNVNYEDKTHSTIFDEMHDLFLNSDKSSDSFTTLMINFVIISPLLKNKNFKSEEECRLIDYYIRPPHDTRPQPTTKFFYFNAEDASLILPN